MFYNKNKRYCDNENFETFKRIDSVKRNKDMLNSLCKTNTSLFINKNTSLCDLNNNSFILIHRNEYVNLFQTFTEIQSVHLTLQLLAEKNNSFKKLNFIFVDGHAKGFLGINKSFSSFLIITKIFYGQVILKVH